MARGAKADLIYGATGTYKTSNIGRAALYAYEKYGLKTRLVSADGGGWEPIQSLVDAGIIQAWAIRTRPHCIEAIDLACQGYWPRDPADSQSPIDIPLKEEDKIGVIAFEGLTSFGSLIMDKLKKPGVQLSQDPSYVLQDGQTRYAGGSLAAYGFVQDRMYDFVMKSHMIPFVRKVIWTALEAKGEEEGTRISIYGPSIEGKKAIGKAGQWFGNMIHMEAVAAEVKEDEQTHHLNITTKIYMYLRPHADPNTKIVFPAKVRAPFQFANEVPQMAPEPDLGRLYAFLDELKKKADATVSQLKKEEVHAR